MANINLRNVPDHLRSQFKAICGLMNTSMTQAIIDFMAEIVHSQTREGMNMNITGPDSNLLGKLLKREPDKVLLEKLTGKKDKEGKSDLLDEMTERIVHHSDDADSDD
jgi:hypothetical protein